MRPSPAALPGMIAVANAVGASSALGAETSIADVLVREQPGAAGGPGGRGRHELRIVGFGLRAVENRSRVSSSRLVMRRAGGIRIRARCWPVSASDRLKPRSTTDSSAVGSALCIRLRLLASSFWRMVGLSTSGLIRFSTVGESGLGSPKSKVTVGDCSISRVEPVASPPRAGSSSTKSTPVSPTARASPVASVPPRAAPRSRSTASPAESEVTVGSPSRSKSTRFWPPSRFRSTPALPTPCKPPALANNGSSGAICRPMMTIFSHSPAIA